MVFFHPSLLYFSIMFLLVFFECIVKILQCFLGSLLMLYFHECQFVKSVNFLFCNLFCSFSRFDVILKCFAHTYSYAIWSSWVVSMCSWIKKSWSLRHRMVLRHHIAPVSPVYFRSFAVVNRNSSELVSFCCASSAHKLWNVESIWSWSGMTFRSQFQVFTEWQCVYLSCIWPFFHLSFLSPPYVCLFYQFANCI